MARTFSIIVPSMVGIVGRRAGGRRKTEKVLCFCLFLSHVSILTRDIDIANLSVSPLRSSIA